MDLPKELQDLLNMILRDLGGQNPIQIDMLLNDVNGYLDALAHNAPQKNHQQREQTVTNAQLHQRCGDFINILQTAVGEQQNGGPFGQTLFFLLEEAFPGGDYEEVAKSLAVMLYWSGAGTLDRLLFSDLSQIFNLLNTGNAQNDRQARQKAGGGSSLISLCLQETNDQPSLYWLIYRLIRIVTYPGGQGNPDTNGAKLIFCIEAAASTQTNPKDPEKQIGNFVKSGLTSKKQGYSTDTLAPNILLMLNVRYMCEAVNHLILGDVHFLDPVIADASCELRPPFILTAYQIVQSCVINLGGLDQCKNYIRLFYQNHSNNVWLEPNIASALDVMGANAEPQNYIRMVRYILQALRQVQDYYVDYLYLCKAMTRARYVTRDEFGIEVDDGERTIIFSINTDRANRARLAGYTVRFIRETAGNLQLNHPGGWIDSIVPVLNNCNVGMMQKNSCLPLLPIYSSEKVALAKACIDGWPIILRLSRIQYVSNTQEYRLLGTAVLVYMPNGNATSYVLAGCWDSVTDNQDWGTNDPNLWGRLPGICVSAYSICSTDGHVENDDQFRVENFGQYLTALKGCDIVHLISLCSANHPPFPGQGGLIQNNTVTPFQGTGDFDYEWGTLYGGQFPGFNDTGGPLTLQSPYSFVNMGVRDEHFDMLLLANRYHLQEARYSDNGGRRIEEMHFYSLHLYTSSFRIEQVRMQTVWQNVNGQMLVRQLNINLILDTFNQSTEDELGRSRNV